MFVHQCCVGLKEDFITCESFAQGVVTLKIHIVTINLINYVTDILIDINDV